jgi:hypothetical protein
VAVRSESSARRRTPTRIFLAILTSLVSVNLWTGGPLFALWVGSRVQESEGQFTMGAVEATLGTLIVVTFLLYKALVFFQTRYNAALGLQDLPRRQSAWLKPMTGERRSIAVRRPLTAVERIVVVSTVVAFEALVIWFFFFAHYKLPG